MRRFVLLSLLTISLLALNAPLIEIASPKEYDYLSFLQQNFPKTKLNIIVYSQYRFPFLSVNGKRLPMWNVDSKLKDALKRKVREALQQEKAIQLTVESLKITKENKKLLFSFSPCNYSKKNFKGKWVAFVTDEKGKLLHRKEGRLELPAGTCGRPVSFSWVGKNNPSRLAFIVAILDEDGEYIISKSNGETEVKEK